MQFQIGPKIDEGSFSQVHNLYNSNADEQEPDMVIKMMEDSDVYKNEVDTLRKIQ